MGQAPPWVASRRGWDGRGDRLGRDERGWATVAGGVAAAIFEGFDGFLLVDVPGREGGGDGGKRDFGRELDGCGEIGGNGLHTGHEIG